MMFREFRKLADSCTVVFLGLSDGSLVPFKINKNRRTPTPRAPVLYIWGPGGLLHKV